MTRSTTLVQVFVASPSDVKEERDLLKSLILELNRIWSRSLGVSFELIRWETHTHPAFGGDPQSIVNTQIGDDYDIFIGILWSRFGTPTPRALSGTAEEFHRAVSRIKNGTPDVMIYFKDAPIAPSKIDAEQLNGVNEFRRSLSNLGLFSVFEDSSSFQSSLRAHLSTLAQQYSSFTAKHAVPDTEKLEAPDSEEDDLGYLDYLEIFQSRLEEATATLDVISEATKKIGAQVQLRTKDVYPGIDVKIAKKIVKIVADDMNAYIEVLRNNLPLLTSSRSASMDALANALTLYDELSSNDASHLADTRSNLVSLTGAVSVSAGQVEKFKSVVDTIPQMSSDLNKAKRALSGQLDSIVIELKNLLQTGQNIISSIDRMLKKLSPT